MRLPIRPRLRPVFLALLLLTGAISLLTPPPIYGPLVMDLLKLWPAKGNCDARRDQRWAALVQGLNVDCPEGLYDGLRSRWMLLAIVQDDRSSTVAKRQALETLSRQNDPAVSELVLSLVQDRNTSPTLRRELWQAAAEENPEESGLMAQSAGLHGLWALGQAARFSVGADALETLPVLYQSEDYIEERIWGGLGVRPSEIRTACHRMAEGLSPTDLPPEWGMVPTPENCAGGTIALLRSLLHAEGHRRGEEHSNPPPLPLGETEIDTWLFRNGAAGDLLRQDIWAIGHWVAMGPIGPRLQAALDHPEASVRAAPGDALGQLFQGAGSPGTAAALSAMIAATQKIDVQYSLNSGGVHLQFADSALSFGDQCPDALPMPPEGALALGLVEAMGRSLRAGDQDAAMAQAKTAFSLWDGPPTRLAALIGLALSPVEPVPLRPELHLLDRHRLELPKHRSRLRAALPTTPPWSWTRQAFGDRADAMRAQSPSSEALTLAAYWAASHDESAPLAPLILPSLPSSPDPLWVAVAVALGEPIGAAQAQSPAPCTQAFYLRLLGPG